MKESLGKRIRQLRQLKSLTQPQLAALAGVSKSMISFWENDISEPVASNIIKLAHVLGVSCDQLLGEED